MQFKTPRLRALPRSANSRRFCFSKILNLNVFLNNNRSVFGWQFDALLPPNNVQRTQVPFACNNPRHNNNTSNPYHINNHDGWMWCFVCCVSIVQHVVAVDVASLLYFMTALMGVVQHTKRTNLHAYLYILYDLRALCFCCGIRGESISRAISMKLTPLEPPSSHTNSTSFSF